MSSLIPLDITNCKSYSTADCPSPIRDYLRALPSSWAADGETLKMGSRSTVTRISVRDVIYVVKIYKSMPIHRRLRYALTQSRAFQSWSIGHTMLTSGIPVARPLAITEERAFGIPSRAALIMENAKGDSLLDLIERQMLNSDQLSIIADKLRSVFSRMLEQKITHGDLKATNIIINQSLCPTFIDIDAAMKHSHIKSYRQSAEKDHKRFMANWQKHPETQEIFRNVFGKIL